MKLFKNKRGDDGKDRPFGEIVGWIILILLLLFMLFWYSGLGNIVVRIFSNYF